MAAEVEELPFETSDDYSDGDDEGVSSNVQMVSEDDLEGVKEALLSGADANETDADGTSLLAIASFFGYEEMCMLLLASDANPNLENATHRWTALTAAASRGHLRIVGALLQAGADPLHKDVHGTTPAQYAEQNGKTDVAELIDTFVRTGTVQLPAGEAALPSVLPAATGTARRGEEAAGEDADPLADAVAAAAGDLPDPIVAPGDEMGALLSRLLACVTQGAGGKQYAAKRTSGRLDSRAVRVRGQAFLRGLAQPGGQDSLMRLV